MVETGGLDVTDPKHPENEQFDDPDSIPVLTDVIVPGRPSMPQRGEAHAPAPETKAEAPAAKEKAEAPAAAPKAEAPAAAQKTEAPAAAPKAEAPPVAPKPEVRAAPATPQTIDEPGIPGPKAAPRAPTEDSIEARRAAQLSEFVEAERASPTEPLDARRPHEPLKHGGAPEAVAPEEAAPASPAPAPLTLRERDEREVREELTERDIDHIAERLRGRFAGYLREEGRRVIEARCREALEEHTSWLVRQVTREVALALEGEVVGWVRDAVRDELAAHRAARR